MAGTQTSRCLLPSTMGQLLAAGGLLAYGLLVSGLLYNVIVGPASTGACVAWHGQATLVAVGAASASDLLRAQGSLTQAERPWRSRCASAAPT